MSVLKIRNKSFMKILKRVSLRIKLCSSLDFQSLRTSLFLTLCLLLLDLEYDSMMSDSI